MAGILLHHLTADQLVAILSVAKELGASVAIPTGFAAPDEIGPNCDNPDTVLRYFLDMAESRVYSDPLTSQIDIADLFTKFDEESDVWYTDDATKEWILNEAKQHGHAVPLEWCPFCESVVPTQLCDNDGNLIEIEHAETAEDCERLH